MHSASFFSILVQPTRIHNSKFLNRHNFYFREVFACQQFSWNIIWLWKFELPLLHSVFFCILLLPSASFSLFQIPSFYLFLLSSASFFTFLLLKYNGHKFITPTFSTNTISLYDLENFSFWLLLHLTTSLSFLLLYSVSSAITLLCSLSDVKRLNTEEDNNKSID